MSESFSSRNNFQSNPPITVWHDAPPELRYALTVIVRDDCAQGVAWTRDALCSILRTPPDSNNWSEGPLIQETNQLICGCPWYRVYEVAEGMFQRLKAGDTSQGRSRKLPGTAETFQAKLNEVMAEKGIGWEMVSGKFAIRGEPVQQALIALASKELEEFSVAQSELKEALSALSRRPDPDITGAISRAFNALEAVSKKLSGSPSADTFGDFLKSNKNLFPQPLGQVMGGLWGYASTHARHGNEERDATIGEAYLVVGIIAAQIIYLSHKLSKDGQDR